MRLTDPAAETMETLRSAYRIRLPKAMSAQINAEAGAVVVNGLTRNLRVATLAGSVEGRGLRSAEVSVRTEVERRP